MAYYSYKARDSQGKSITGFVEAVSKEAATRLLHDKQLFVVGLTETRNREQSAVSLKFRRVGFGEIVNFTRQLATMVVAGLSLPEALTILRVQTPNPALVTVLNEIEHQIVSGGNLGDALAKYPQHFSQIYIALVRAGESSGQLDQVLIRLADSMESQRDFRSKVSGAMIYPVIIMVGMGIVVMIMMTVVIPKLTELYNDFGVDLPFATQLLISISQFFVSWWWLVIAAVVGGGYAFLRWKETKVGQLIVDTVILSIPLFGELQKKIILVEFTRTLSMLITSGIRLLDALTILKDALDNVLFRNAIVEISKKVERGFPLGDTFGQYPVFPPIVSQMMKVGEETGKLDDTLLKLSKYFASESENLVKGLTTAIEPIIMVFLGVGVGFIVIAVITPIYNLTSQFK
ncbi:type II secretion system F family protein [Candidatus Gottesmanbacteria bacterium]|nr:type II secretion system F family protein [Candidatus Gottesmanbacteria bacterium]